MGDREVPDRRADARAHIRELRDRLRSGGGGGADEIPGDAVDDEPTLDSQARAELRELEVRLQTVQVKYEMELAAHRDTAAALLAEKDRTIAKLEELVTELRCQLDAAGDRSAMLGEDDR